MTCGCLLQLLRHEHVLVPGLALPGDCLLEGAGWGPSGGFGPAAADGSILRLRGGPPKEVRPRWRLVSTLRVGVRVVKASQMAQLCPDHMRLDSVPGT